MSLLCWILPLSLQIQPFPLCTLLFVLGPDHKQSVCSPWRLVGCRQWGEGEYISLLLFLWGHLKEDLCSSQHSLIFMFLSCWVLYIIPPTLLLFRLFVISHDGAGFRFLNSLLWFLGSHTFAISPLVSQHHWDCFSLAILLFSLEMPNRYTYARQLIHEKPCLCWNTFGISVKCFKMYFLFH